LRGRSSTGKPAEPVWSCSKPIRPDGSWASEVSLPWALSSSAGSSANYWAMREPAPVFTNRLQCCECGRVSRDNERGRPARLDCDDGVQIFCPECDEREFGDARASLRSGSRWVAACDRSHVCQTRLQAERELVIQLERRGHRRPRIDAPFAAAQARLRGVVAAIASHADSSQNAFRRRPRLTDWSVGKGRFREPVRPVAAAGPWLPFSAVPRLRLRAVSVRQAASRAAGSQPSERSSTRGSQRGVAALAE
jgi:hypothetical protein